MNGGKNGVSATKTSRETARARRERLLVAWRAGGLNGAAFCRREGVNYKTFSGWRQRAARQDAGKFQPQERLAVEPRQAGPHFVPLTWSGAPSESTWGVELVLRNGRILRLPWAIAPETAARWAAALDE